MISSDCVLYKALCLYHGEVDDSHDDVGHVDDDDDSGNDDDHDFDRLLQSGILYNLAGLIFVMVTIVMMMTMVMMMMMT